MLDSITVARCANRRLNSAKRLLPGRDPSLKDSWVTHDQVFEVDLETHNLTGLGSILSLLRQLQPDRHAFVMRGAPTAEALAKDCRRVRRTSRARLNKWTGVSDAAYLEARARRWAVSTSTTSRRPRGWTRPAPRRSRTSSPTCRPSSRASPSSTSGATGPG